MQYIPFSVITKEMGIVVVLFPALHVLLLDVLRHVRIIDRLANRYSVAIGSNHLVIVEIRTSFAHSFNTVVLAAECGCSYVLEMIELQGIAESHFTQEKEL